MTPRVKRLLTRVFLLLGVIGIAIIFDPIFHYFLTQGLHYKPSPFYFGSIEAIIISFIFFMGVIFGTRGSKFEIGWIILFFTAALILSWQLPNPGFGKYFILISMAIAGNAIGYLLKKIRERFFWGGNKLGRI